ncbi:MAG TPA: hypothetical protein VJ891_07025 [Casimicrobiaceae bacterium]|nr:hypothetical protein [Casimicrobiaceae bacterium]
MKCIAVAMLSLALLCAYGGAFADVRVSVAATDPPAEATLGRDEPFYVRIEFSSDEPIQIWARPYLDGKPAVKTRSNPSFPHSGHGYALGWFSLDDAERVDEVRIKVGGGKPYREWIAATYPVNVIATSVPAVAHERQEWVDEMRRAEDEAQQQAYRQRMNEPVGAGTSLLMMLFGFATLALLAGGIAIPLRAIWKWRGGWRMAAVIPIALMGFVVLRIIIGTSIDPTSHNLWPFEILMWGSVSLLILGGIAVVRRVRGG